MPINIKVTIYSTFKYNIHIYYLTLPLIKDMNLDIMRHILLDIVLYLVCIVSAKIRGNVLITTLCKGIRLQFIFKKYEGCYSNRRKQVF